MTEAELERLVADTARLFGWRVAHFGPARTARGWRTPARYDGAGFPDLVLARDRIVFAELKTNCGRPTVEQRAWLDTLAAAGCETHIWKPRHFDDGTIVDTLRARQHTDTEHNNDDEDTPSFLSTNRPGAHPEAKNFGGFDSPGSETSGFARFLAGFVDRILRDTAVRLDDAGDVEEFASLRPFARDVVAYSATALFMTLLDEDAGFASAALAVWERRLEELDRQDAAIVDAGVRYLVDDTDDKSGLG